jgi:hypothetical protein
MANEEILSGGCACGQLRFEARGAPNRVGLCHCMTCRKISGSVFSALAIYPADKVTITGESNSWEPAPGSQDRFCPKCGSQVFYTDGSDEIELKMGAFDEPNRFTPTYEAWAKRRESWLRTPDLISYPENRGEVTS